MADDLWRVLVRPAHPKPEAENIVGAMRSATKPAPRLATLVYLTLRSLLAAEWKSIEQRVPITWTNCHFGGRRPWFVCSVRAKARRQRRPV